MIHIFTTCDTTKIALRASRHERKGEPLSKEMKKYQKTTTKKFPILFCIDGLLVENTSTNAIDDIERKLKNNYRVTVLRQNLGKLP